jgi:hypothetical protein
MLRRGRGGYCSREVAYNRLKPFFGLFWEGWLKAFQFAQMMASAWPYPQHHPACRAQIMNPLMCDFMRANLKNTKGVSVIESETVLLVDFGGEVMTRFKKFDNRLRASNIETEHQVRMFAQEIQDLPNMPAKSTIVIVGYLLDEAGGAIQDVPVTLPREFGGGNHWHFLMPKPGTGMLGLPAQSPTPMPALPVAPKVRLRGKKVDKD